MKAEQFIRLQLLYSSALFRSIRIFIAFVIIVLLILHFASGESLKPAAVAFFLLLIIEIFFRFHIYRYHPTIPVSKNSGKNPTASISKDALLILLSADTIQDILRNLCKSQHTTFMLQKMGIVPEELKAIDMTIEQVIESCPEVVKTVRGEYITTMDLLVAYLLLTEEQTKILFQHELKSEDCFQILIWGRYLFTNEENEPAIRVNFKGEGFAEGLVYGWTPETKNYTTDFSYRNIKPFLVGREVQYKMMLEALSKKENNNILLVGEVGVGKENLVAQLARDSYDGQLSRFLNHKRVLQLMVGALIAGTESRSELEVRLEAIVSEISHSNNVILYISDFENLMGSSSFNLDISGALMPYLQAGNLPIIASMTNGNFKTYIQQKPLQEVFTVIRIDEPLSDIALQMLIAKTAEIEEKNDVVLTFHCIKTTIDLANRYVQDAVLPGNAVTLLNDTANSVALSSKATYFGKSKRKLVFSKDVEQQVSLRTHVNIGNPTTEEKDVLLHLEDRIHEYVVDQAQAIKAVSEAIRRIRSGLQKSTRPISFLFLGPTGVGKTQTAKALARVYFGGEEKIIRLDMSEFADVDGERRLLGSAPGEGDERGELTDKIHDNPFSLVLLDEFEKAHPKILNLFLQVLDDGRLTDNKGRTASFINAIIIATSNAGAEYIREQLVQDTTVDKLFQQRLLEYLQQNQLFRPELLNRFDDIITFSPLGPGELRQIVQLQLKDIVENLAEQDITLIFDTKVLDKIIQEGSNISFGARPLRRFIQDNIEDLIARGKLNDKIKRGDKIMMLTDTEGKIIYTNT